MPSSPQPQRPSPVTRNSSASLQQLRSPSTGQTPPTRSAHHKPQRHVVGHGSARIGPRNPSFGKNINKLAKLTPIDAGEEKDTSRHHKRSLSGNATPSSSPRQGNVKRNASALAIAQEARAQVAAQMRKNHSSGQLQRGGSSKALAKQMKQDARLGMKRTASSQGKVPQQAKSPKSPKHPSVRFAFGNDEEQDDGWTEDSASQSPSTTRDTTRNNTRNNSMVLEPGKTENQPPDQTEAAQQRMKISQYPDGHANGLTQHRTSRPPDADAITSRLLQRHPSNNAPPQTSKVSAVGQTNDSSSPQTISQSQGSTIGGTPGSHLVSRFINGDTSTTGTPIRDSQTSLIQRLHPSPPSASSLSKNARNKSTPNLSPARPTSATSTPPSQPQQQPPTSSDSQSQTPTGGSSGGGVGSGTTSAGAAAASAATPLPSSRTQQKLWLQRASTTAEPNSLVPATLPRTGTGPAAALAGLGGGLPPFGVPHLHHHSHSHHHHHSAHHRHTSRSSAEGGGGEEAGSAAGSAGTGGGAGEDSGAPRVDPRLQRLFDTAEGQYRAVRRFRDPVGEAVGRVRGARAKDKAKGKGKGVRGKAAVVPAVGKKGVGRQEEVGSAERRRRPKVSFEGVKASGAEDEEEGGGTRPGSRDSGVDEGRGGEQRGRDEVQEICRRMWGMLDGGVED